MRNKIVILGLDACDPDLIQHWVKEGRLPFLSSLIQKGVWARLLSTSKLFSEPWPSFNTGVSPAKHLYYNFLQLKRGTTEIIRADAYDISYLPFWTLLERGRKIVAFDVPKTYPISGVHGMQVASWGEHYPLSRSEALPPALLKEINSRFGKYSHPDEVITPSFSCEMRLYQKMLVNVERKAKAIRFLQNQEDWDLFFSVFSETHYGGHQLYQYYDHTHWAHDSQRAHALSESLPTIYSRLDSSISEILRNVSDDTTVFIVSVHGILANYSGYTMLSKVMEKLGFQIPPVNGTKNQSSFLRDLREKIPNGIREFVNERILPQSVQDKVYSRLFSSNIDWQRSRAFFLPSDQFQGFISLNLKGREPSGTVNPGAEYDEVCQEVRNELMQLVNPDTGKSAVQEVVQVSKVYQPEKLFHLPDLVIRWAEGAYIRKLYHPKFGVISDGDFKNRRTQHTAEGFMIAAGKNISPQVVLQEASTVDLAPTILYLLGEPIPEDMDGKVLLDLISSCYRDTHTPQFRSRRLTRV